MTSAAARTARVPPPDAHDVRRVARAPGLLRDFNAAGVLGPADVHVGLTIGRLTGEGDPDVLLAAALAVRGPRLGHVCVDLETVRETVTTDDDRTAALDELPWPEPSAWRRNVAASTLVASAPTTRSTGSAVAEDRPLRLVGARLYLDRYWRYEQQVLTQLQARSRPADVDLAVLRAGLDRLLPTQTDQRRAAATAVLRQLSVIAGGPGTGKTKTVARLLALLAEQAAARGGRPLRVALAAPTGKAANRMQESVRAQTADLDVDETTRAWLTSLTASTIHRLLGVQSDNATRFRHDRRAPLTADVVVVDEMSMVSLALIAKLLDAVRPQARVVLLGDPEQLASVEAGAVLGDLVGPAIAGTGLSGPARAALARAIGAPDAPGVQDAPGTPVAPGPAVPPIADGVVLLRHVHRFRGDSGIAALADALQRGDPDEVLAVAASGRDDVRWSQPAEDAQGLHRVREDVVATGIATINAARVGDHLSALSALSDLRVLCAHRRGPSGIRTWIPLIEGWLARHAGVAGLDLADPWYVGRPVLVTRNDYQLGVRNGDVGVVVRRLDGRVTVAVEGVGDIGPTRLDHVETVYAMTVHKSQGSQFRRVVVVLPEPDSPILTRELLYTAVTRARESVTLIGTPDALRAAVERRVQRASGLRESLWQR